MSVDCKVCGAIADPFGQATVLGKYTVEYARCRDCGFVQTEPPYWLDEAYRNAIIPTDVGLIARNQRFSRRTSILLRHVLPRVTHGVDYGGGYGMFTRMMRDRGHDFTHTDPHCKNLFAVGLEADPQRTDFDFLTAFEVWEHLAEPHQEIARMDEMAEHWLVSTIPLPEPTPLPGTWWYYATEGGQHVALWTRRALQAVASQYGRRLVSAGGLHLFTTTRVNALLVRQILRGRASWLDRFRQRESLTQRDYQAALSTNEQSEAA